VPGPFRNSFQASLTIPAKTANRPEKLREALKFKDFKDLMTQVKSVAATARKALDRTDETESRELWR
jgi:pterin-4a-carbinolamine dehydratase